MVDIPNVIQELLNKFDATLTKVSEAAIYDALKDLKIDASSEDTSFQFFLKAESMAFGFYAKYPDEKTGWGTYYGPMMVLPDENGKMFEYPSIRLVDKDVLEYWQQRSEEAKHPVLRYRYANLVWDFTRTILSINPNISLAHFVIDSALDIASKDLCKHEMDTINKLERALSLTLSISDTVRRDSVINAMIAYEDKVAIDDKCGLWGFSFRKLISNKKVPLSDDQEKKIISELEERLKRTSDDGTLDPFAAEHAAMMLSEYYRKKGNTEEIKRVLLIFGKTYVDMSEKASGLLASIWMQKVFEVYKQNGMQDEANALTERIQEFGKQSIKEMHPISAKIEISQEKIEKFLSEMTQGDMNEILTRLAFYYLPSDREEVKNQIEEFAKETPFLYLFKTVKMDRDGRAIAEIGSLEEDLDGHIVNQTSENMKISDISLNMVIDKLITDKRLILQEIIDYLFKSPVFDENRKAILEIGINAFLYGDHIVAAHVLVPQIEHALRSLMKLTVGPVYKPSRYGGYLLRTLDEILRDEGVTKALGDNITHYFRVLLTDQRGWNLRNNICHGLQDSNTFEKSVGNRLFHVLLILAHIRMLSTENSTPSDE
jgi:hypothetical protein